MVAPQGNPRLITFPAAINQRFTRIHGAGSVITCDYKGNWVEARKFPSNTFERINLSDIRAGPGGADKIIVRAFRNALWPEKTILLPPHKNPSKPTASSLQPKKPGHQSDLHHKNLPYLLQ